jgi:hypothetical protein
MLVSSFRKSLLLAIPSIAALLAIAGFNFFSSVALNGQFTYPLDDTYIHMSISRNLMAHGVWGVTPFEFTSTSSSILYTLLLAGSFKIFGVNLFIPLILNIVLAISLLLWLTHLLKDTLPTWQLLILTMSMVIFVPLAGMSILGMEHVLQIGSCLFFMWYTYLMLIGNNPKTLAAYYLIAAVAVLTRYESLFLIGLTSGMWALIFRKWKLALGLLFFGLLPVVLFGWYSVANGGFFLPNSILAKSQIGSSGIGGFMKLFSAKLLFNSLPAALLFFPITYWLLEPLQKTSNIRHYPLHLCWLLFGTTLISHVAFANLGWMFRYEAYLIALAIFLIGLSYPTLKKTIANQSPWNISVFSVCCLFICFGIFSRFSIVYFTNRAIKNIHDQQWQMGTFVAKYFPESTLAIGDIGAVSYLNPRVKIMDLEGLASNEILLNKNKIDSNFLKAYSAKSKASFGLFYTHLYQGKIPGSWELLGTWMLPDNFVGAGAEVGIFAIDKSSRDTLLHALRLYDPNLPKSVIRKGKFQ